MDAILAAQHDDGGWALTANLANTSDPDVTGMALTALYPYREQPAVAAACEEAFACLSTIQNDNGTYTSGGAQCAESCSWVIVATTTWGINPDTDSRFIKNGSSVVDGLLAHYLPDSAAFQHIIGAGTNAMATDQSCYALVAYDRFVKGKAALYDYSDVTFDTPPEADEMTAILGLPEKINEGDSFNAVISTNQWDNEAGYKLIDFIMTVPKGLSVTDVTDSGSQVYTDGKDKYLTDPIPEGKPKPVEPEDQDVDKGQTHTCTFSIECSTILNNLDQLDPDKLEMVPSGGTILTTTTVTFYEGESVFDVLQRVCKEKGIHLESSWTPIYNSAYIEGIHNLYEFDCGALSGWMYRVNGWYPNYGCSRYQLQDGDVGGKNLF